MLAQLSGVLWLCHNPEIQWAKQKSFRAEAQCEGLCTYFSPCWLNVLWMIDPRLFSLAGTSWCIFHVHNVPLQCFFSPSVFLAFVCLFCFTLLLILCASLVTPAQLLKPHVDELLCFSLRSSRHFRDDCHNHWFSFHAWQLIYFSVLLMPLQS